MCIKENSWDLRESEIANAAWNATLEASFVDGKWDLDQVDKCLSLFVKREVLDSQIINFKDLWKMVKDFITLKRVSKGI